MIPRKFGLYLLLCLTPLTAIAGMVPKAPDIEATGYLLMDANSGQLIVEHNVNERLPPASLTKMMTSYIAASELHSGHISLKDKAPISVAAWKMGGSRMFIREGTDVAVEDLMRGIIIQSGNDASVAMAEYIAGSEDAFADLMNQQAARLGMNDSHFVNATGWPADNHYSSAHDLAILARHIINDFPEHYEIYSEKSFVYNNITQQNRNLMLWRDDRVDGLKTGHTDAAGFCLVSSAKDGDMRLISVVMGTNSEQARAQETQKLLTYGFRFFETYKAYSEGDGLTTVRVWMGQENELKLGPAEDLVLTIPRGNHDQLKAEMTVNPDVTAPIHKGDILGTAIIRMDGEVLLEKPLVALNDVEQAGIFKRMWHHIVRFFANLF
ncbi:MAG: D-alanyl-D-alanine carboxypeptidase [Alcanivoracaceae bacterium]|nr:D-alanyl-D-alanine carboxypeptidase [Alcanivoracaceae bacterium]